MDVHHYVFSSAPLDSIVVQMSCNRHYTHNAFYHHVSSMDMVDSYSLVIEIQDFHCVNNFLRQEINYMAASVVNVSRVMLRCAVVELGVDVTMAIDYR